MLEYDSTTPSQNNYYIHVKVTDDKDFFPSGTAESIISPDPTPVLIVVKNINDPPEWIGSCPQNCAFEINENSDKDTELTPLAQAGSKLLALFLYANMFRFS